MKSICNTLIYLTVALLLSSCAHTYQAPRIETDNFLNDYTQIKEIGEDDYLLSYWKKGVNWARYKKIIIEPIVIIKANGSEFNQMVHAEGYRLKEMLDFQIQDALKNDFKRVNKQGPDTLLLQFVITEADTLTVLLKKFSPIYHSTQIFSAVKPLLTGKEPYSNKVGIEGKIMDSTTGELLMVSADARAGGKTLVGFSGEWMDIGEAYQFLAIHLSYQFCLRQGRIDCQKPKPE